MYLGYSSGIDKKVSCINLSLSFRRNVHLYFAVKVEQITKILQSILKNHKIQVWIQGTFGGHL